MPLDLYCWRHLAIAAKDMEQDAPEVRKAIATFREHDGILGMADALLAGRALSYHAIESVKLSLS